ncbi:PEP-CTERM putative exosortase interaction domain-containing protein [Burkholderiales bacterium JOSHI_001]|nr:PEP-CTERM putative exosortase interaction domain-containing protein [Burkholderiales bacterium JOSHI_001]
MRTVLAAVALAALSTLAQAAAPTVSCSGGVVNCAAAMDGVDPTLLDGEGTSWTDRSAFWEGTSGRVNLALGGTFQLMDIAIVVDNNDDYLIERSLDNSTWFTLGSINRTAGNVPVSPGGMDYFDSFNVPGNIDYVATLDFAPVNAAFLRVRATGGDSSYSVAEVSLWTNPVPVPEPATWALMLGGVAALVSRRRRAQD